LPIGAYDALGYRLPAIAAWLDAGAVVWVPGDDPLRNGYPLGLEVIAAVCFRAFDSAAAVDAVSVPFALSGALALASFARELGVPRWGARLAAGLFLLVPMQLLNAPSGYVDAAFAGGMVALFVAVARWARAGIVVPWLAADVGIAAALVTALKPHGFAFAALALAAGLWRRLRALDVRQAMQEFGRVLALASPGLFFAGRNAMMTGNPLYPLELRLGERVLLRGESSLDGILTPAFNVPRELAGLPSLLRPFWVWLQPHGPARSFDDRLAGFGYAFVAVGLPALAWAAWRSRAAPDGRGLALVIGLTFACWLLQPLSFWPRFTSWVWGAAALAIALAVSELVRTGRSGGALALACGALVFAVPEALYALAHVKGIDRLGLSVLGDDPITQLARVSGVDRQFVQRALVGKRDVCRTPWRLGTDDANLDGVVAQLSPRPRVHVVDDERWSALPRALRAHGCDQLIAIGDSPLLKQLPADASVRVEPALAFGPCHLVSLSLPEVIP
ncbi:MAG TPA: hypothetical protein VG963_22905, partial [Polyangiaceae bacterium]|nr:hypothetical protein [Polyangiaceae bacterium]